MSFTNALTSTLESEAHSCERCGCGKDRTCTVEVIVTRPDGRRATLLTDKCAGSTPGLCTACDERLIPELASLLDVWRQLGAIAMAFRTG
jgi:hypothetical protein